MNVEYETDPSEPEPRGGSLERPVERLVDLERRSAPAHRPALRPAGVQGSPSLGGALLRHWWLILLLALACTAAALYVASGRAPTYTSQVQFNVGSIDVRTQALPGFAEGAKTLATAYSRVAVSDAVIGPIARDVEMDPVEVKARLTVTPLPGSPVVTVAATGATEREAIELTQSAGNQLRRYIKSQEDSASVSVELLSRYRRLTQRANELAGREASLKAAREREATSVSRDRIATAETRTQTALTRAEAVKQRYQNAVQNDEKAGEIRLINEASSATSDRSSTFQKLGFVGFAGGTVIGVALALLLDSMRRRRLRRSQG